MSRWHHKHTVVPSWAVSGRLSLLRIYIACSFITAKDDAGWRCVDRLAKAYAGGKTEARRAALVSCRITKSDAQGLAEARRDLLRSRQKRNRRRLLRQKRGY